MFRFRSLALTALVAAFALVIAACGEPEDDQDNHDNDNNHEESHVADMALIDGDGNIVVDTHGSHWHGDPLVLDEHDDELELYFVFYDEDGDELELQLDGSHYSVEAHGFDSSIVDIDVHGDHVDIEPVHEGETEVHFALFHDGDEIYESPDLVILIVHEHGNDDELHVHEFILLDRAHDPHEPIVDSHGDHWHGDFAGGIGLSITEEEIEPGSSDWYERGAAGTEPEAVSLGVLAFDDDDDEISIPGHYRLEAVHAHSGDDDIVYITESHGDHVHIVGIGEGHAHVIFQLVSQSDDEVVYESPELEFDVH